jgi:hypothetical protein
MVDCGSLPALFNFLSSVNPEYASRGIGSVRHHTEYC